MEGLIGWVGSKWEERRRIMSQLKKAFIICLKLDVSLVAGLKNHLY